MNTSHAIIRSPNESILNNLGSLHNTDKSSTGRSRDIKKPNGDIAKDFLPGHDYLRKYELYLEKFRQEIIMHA